MNALNRINQMNRSLEDELSVLLRQRSDAAWDRQLPGYGALSHRDATIRMGQLDTLISAALAELFTIPRHEPPMPIELASTQRASVMQSIDEAP